MAAGACLNRNSRNAFDTRAGCTLHIISTDGNAECKGASRLHAAGSIQLFSRGDCRSP